jgi:3-dehydro-L-gulonate 2-dehydrogenase
MRIMPMGYWKGSSFAFMLDILGSVLSDGVGAVDLNAATKGSCGGCSQVMIVIDPKKTMDGARMEETIRRAAEYVKSAEPDEHGSCVHVPGEGCERFHKEHDAQGIFVDDAVWEEILAL